MQSLSNNPILRTLIVLLILVSVGLLGSRFATRLDLTQNKEFTLSGSTGNVLERLDDLVNVKVYFSKNLPSYLATLDRQVKDLLDEYEAAANGRLTVEFIDPDEDPALAQSVQMMGIPKLQLSQYQEERAEVMTAFLGIAVQYEDQTEVIPIVQNITRLEYDLTSAIVKVSTDERTVGIAVTGAAAQNAQVFEQVLGEQYTTRAVDLNAAEVPFDITTLVVIDDDTWSDEALYRIDQFVMRGGRLLAFANAVNVDLNTLQARPRQVRMGELLRSYGVEVLSTLVVDAQAPLVSFDVGFVIPLSLRYPWFVQSLDTGLSRDNAITSDLQSLVLPWTSPLRLSAPDSGGAVSAEVLARSSERSFAKSAPWDLNPQSKVTPPDAFEAQDLAVALSGSFTSRWADGSPVPGDTTGTAAAGPQTSPETRIVVVGSWNLVDGRFLQQYQNNALFLANAVDWMTLGTDLIEIRSRAAVDRPLREVDEDRRGLLKALAVFAVPFLVTAFGILRWRWQGAKRRRDAVEFGGGAA